MREREDKEGAGAMRNTVFLRGETKIFGFERSQAIPARPSNKDRFERGKNVGKWTFIGYEQRHEVEQGLY
jgi:hypothetical protein